MKVVSREELYALVWETPMYRLGEQFGMSGNGLAKICDRLQVPYPPRGHWAKQAVGKATPAPKLPTASAGTASHARLRPTLPRAKPSAEEQSAAKTASTKTEGSAVPDDLTLVHRIVRGWIAEHKREQKQRAEEIRRRKGNEWAWSGPPVDDLTERDLYRFRVSSAIFEAVEEAGGRIKEAPIDGKVTFRIAGQDVECSIVEKLCKPLMKPVGDAAKWTAFPNYRLNSFHCTGFLRVKITSYLGRTAPDWIETRQKKISDWLPEIVGGIIGAGVTLGERERERVEAHRFHLEEEARRLEIQRQRDLNTHRWEQFREAATDWDEYQKLQAMISALADRLKSDGDVLVGERSLSQWLDWAREHAEEINPLRRELDSIFFQS